MVMLPARWAEVDENVNATVMYGAKRNVARAIIISMMIPIFIEYRKAMPSLSYAFAPYATPVTETTAVAIPRSGIVAMVTILHPARKIATPSVPPMTVRIILMITIMIDIESCMTEAGKPT